jgi:hypothetical protein
MFWVVVAKKIRPGTFGEQRQLMTIRFDGKIGIEYPMHRVNDAKVEIGYYRIGIETALAKFQKMNGWMSQVKKIVNYSHLKLKVFQSQTKQRKIF